MRRALTLLAFCICIINANAQTNISYTINCNADRHSISPYIYGINNGIYKPATFRRWGGNRTSAYNWENNFSNAGADYINNNDDYLPYISGLVLADYKKPAQVIIAFHDSSLLQNAFSAVTLPMVGYVSNDGDGVVQANELAPSPRWCAVHNVKPGPLSFVPDTTDHQVFVNEELNFLVNNFGQANNQNGIKAYIMDNEPGLWCNQFPHMRSNCVTYGELLSKSISLANTVKGIDNSGMTFGPESFGFSEFTNLQNASDANNYSGDHWFLDTYLKTMKHASDSVGERILDVFSVHWYPETELQSGASIFSEDITQATATARMQRPRTLWDSTYLENTWIATYFAGDLPLLPHIVNSVSQYFPGTKTGITEYDYGAFSHISGGIAEADALGAFGRCGLDFASLWEAPVKYATLAFDLYRNYDGNNGTFGNTHVFAKTTDTTTSVYAATEDSTAYTLHVVVMNKDYNNAINATINIQNNTNYTQVEGYYFSASDTTMQHVIVPPADLNNNVLTYTLPPLSVYHFILKAPIPFAVQNVAANKIDMTVYPNPAGEVANINYNTNAPATITIKDIAGRTIKEYKNLNGKGKLTVNGLNAGMYIVYCTDGVHTKTEKLIITK